MQLKSTAMQLSAKERSWLSWFGVNGKLALGRSCYLNKNTYSIVEQTFEGIATTRVQLLTMWTNNHWDYLGAVRAIVEHGVAGDIQTCLQRKCEAIADFSELFLVDEEGSVIASSYQSRIGQKHLQEKALYQASHSERFLHGPYVDDVTLKIGASTSKFHDEVTLMFYLPIKQADNSIQLLCGRVPNDVIGDIIQREAGHIFPESGDNYLFMVNSKYDPTIKPGIALSRSRFEDNAFSHGENLKSGVNTDFGVVKIDKHTEFEIRFTDPATGELHPGVRETIKNGENLFVTYPGYSDYRHIPVIGKGVTFSLPGSLDTWGMMCEGDLEEVYRRRSINLSLMKIYLFSLVSVIAVNSSLFHFTHLDTLVINGITAAVAGLSCLVFSFSGTNKVSLRLNEMTSVIRTIAEGGGNLTQRLDPNTIKHDETGDMSRWINSFIDNLDGIVGQVIQASHNVKLTNEVMLEHNQDALVCSNQVHQSMLHMQGLIGVQRNEILNAAAGAEDMKETMAKVVAKANASYNDVRSGTQAIRDIVDNTAKSVHLIDDQMSDIGNIISVITDITNQTNLLALNAAIEAARAGEHGRGFSVVADEVRNLAARTAAAATDIQNMIQGLQSETKQAVRFMETGVENVDQSLKLTEASSSENTELHQLVQNLFDTINVIEQNSSKNGQTAREVTIVTEKMANVIHELAGSSNQVDTTANKLQQLVSEFQVGSR
ncbi:methyl-accepting chemotaxis protein [uncultured Paraglaciecola sp.]|uniref:methyl-accepting chemotaxis protein n=1 Tax=uncultured Paraglaciecola sp. TaxID=1765024 RepID=UPI0030D9F906